MDKNEIAILRELRHDSRKTLVDIGKITGIPVSTVFDKLSRMEAKGMIRYAGLYNFDKMGHNIKVNYLLKSSNKLLHEFLSNCERINNLYRVNNGYDYYLEAVFKNFSELEEFNEQLFKQKIEKHMVFHTLEELKKEDFVIE